LYFERNTLEPSLQLARFSIVFVPKASTFRESSLSKPSTTWGNDGNRLMKVAEFIAKWRRVELTESSAVQQHFLDLCELFDHLP